MIVLPLCWASLLYAGKEYDKRRPVSITCYDKPYPITGTKARLFMQHTARTVRKHAIDKPRQAGCETSCHLRNAERFAAHHTGSSFGVGGMRLFGRTRVSPVDRFHVCTYPDCWAHLELEEGIIEKLLLLLLLLLLTWLSKVYVQSYVVQRLPAEQA